MATKTLISGDNSVVIEFSNLTTATELLDAIEAAITTHGWELLDTAEWVDGNHIIRTYRALNKDGTTYKIAQFRMDIVSDDIFIYVYEDYDPVTHVGTNLASSCGTFLPVEVRLAYGGRLYLMVSPRWLALNSINATNNIISHTMGCFEILPAHATDTTPHYAWVHLAALGGYMVSGYQRVVCPPSTLKNTGDTAAQYSGASTSFGVIGNNFAYDNSTTYQNSQSEVIPTATDKFSAGSYNAYDYTILYDKVQTYNATAIDTYVKGKLYGIKAFTTDAGKKWDVASIECDADLFTSNGGTSTDHIILDTLSLIATSRFAIPK